MGYGFIIFPCVRDTACSYHSLYVCYNIIGHKTVYIISQSFNFGGKIKHLV